MLKDSSENAAVLKDSSEKAAVLKDNSEKSGTQFSNSSPSRPRRSRLWAKIAPWMPWAISKRSSKTCVRAAAEISSQSDSPITPNKPTVRKRPRRALTKDEALQVLSDFVGGMRKLHVLKRDRRMWLEIAELPPDAALSEPPQPLCEGSQVAPHRGREGGGHLPSSFMSVVMLHAPDPPIPCAHLARIR